MQSAGGSVAGLSQCYCCPSASRSSEVPMSSSSHLADLDRALNELGMLSSIAEGRREYIREQRRRRDRNNSEPSHAHYLIPESSVTHEEPTSNTPINTPLNSPTRPTILNNAGYQVVKINPKYVTCVNPSAACVPPTQSGDVCGADRSPEFSRHSGGRRSDTPVPVCRGAAEYNPDDHPLGQRLENQAHLSRVSRARLSFRRRSRQKTQRPYSVPHSASDVSKLRHYSCAPIDHSVLSGLISCRPHLRNTDYLHIAETPPSDLKTTFNWPEPTLPRSRSLDEVDFAKLCIAESNAANGMQIKESSRASDAESNIVFNVDNQNTDVGLYADRREMDSVSQHFRNLHVQ